MAGFIGSHLAEELIALGNRVRGVDCFTPYYEREAKESNLAPLRRAERFEFVEADLRTADLGALIDDIDVVFHQSAQAGVRLSWAGHFTTYVEHNVVVTQRLLEACRATAPRFVYASSSSVYGNAPRYPTVEDDRPHPHSPYGVTKLAAEHLCSLYATNWRLPVVSLRYFTVYGPRQRPDMAIHRLIESALTGALFELYGDGAAVRDFTYVSDVVRANVAAASYDVAPGTVLNVAGGTSTSMNEVVGLVGRSVGREVPVERLAAQPGDVDRTGGDIDRARLHLGWQPVVPLDEGIAAQVAWHRSRPRSS